MTFERFKTIIETYRKFEQDLSDLYDLGIDFYEGKYKLMSHAEEILSESMQSHYNHYGWEWISWFIWENDYGQRKLEAWDADKNLTAQTLEELHQMLEKEYKNG